MTTTEQNPAREEYFVQLMRKAADWYEEPIEDSKNAVSVKNDILGVTYDANVDLQKRVEELQAALKKYVEFHERIQSLGFISRVVGAPIKNTASKLLTPKQ